MQELTQEEMKSIQWFLNANMEEILMESVKNNWHRITFDKWINFKKAQYLEKIAFKEK